MQGTPSLPILNRVCDELLKAQKAPFADAVFVCVQHILETTSSLFESILKLGAAPESVFVLGKSYSTVRAVEAKLKSLGVYVQSSNPERRGGFGSQIERDAGELWTVARRRLKSARTLVVLDEGGFCLKAMPPGYCLGHLTDLHVTSIEQTMSGIFHKPKLPIPVIRTASCAAKRFLEPPIIMREILVKIEADSTDVLVGNCGVIGIGNIGQAVAAKLWQMKGSVFIYDHKGHQAARFSQGKRGVIACRSAAELIQKADVIFGCTGRDCLADVDLTTLPPVCARRFISCSSGDTEFSYLLKQFRHFHPGFDGDPCADLQFEIAGRRLVLHGGGFPINFDRLREAAPAGEIQLTRALLLGSLIQAAAGARLKRDHTGGEMLSPAFQRFVVKNWFADQPNLRADYSAEVLAGMENERWIRQKSGGTDYHKMELAGLRFE